MRKIDVLLKDFLDSECVNVENTQLYPPAIRALKLFISNHEGNKISWEEIHNEIIRIDTIGYGAKFLMLAVLFTIKLDEEQLLTGQYAGVFKKYSDIVSEYVKGYSKNKLTFIKSKDFSPVCIIKKPSNKEDEKRERRNFLVFPNISETARNIIEDYFVYCHNNKTLDIRIDYGLYNILLLLVTNNCFYDDLSKYNDATFIFHFNYIRKNANFTYCKNTAKYKNKCLNELINFYYWIETNLNQETRNKNFKVYDLSAFKYPYIVSAIKNGFEFVKYSIYDEPPKADKLVIDPQKSSLHQTAEIDKLVCFDVSAIKNDFLRAWIKECYWFDTDHKIYDRTKTYAPILEFIKKIDDKYKKNEKPSIGVDDVLSYKATCVACDISSSTVLRKLSIVKYFLEYINEKNYLPIDQLLFRLLSYHDTKNESYKETYTKEEIKELLSAYEDFYKKCKNKDRKLSYILFYYVIAILSISEMRVSTILNLKTDCLVKTLERNNSSEYKVVVQSKTSGRDFEEYNITKYVKGLIDEVLNLTKEIRASSTGVEKDYLFIYRRSAHKVSSVIRQDALSVHHKKICKEYGIRELKLGAIRNYYQQQVSDYVTEKGDDPMLIERLSKHGINVHIQHYDAVDIKDFCQRFYQVEIGSIELKGRVEEKNDRPVQSSVSNGCGHCGLSECVLKGNLECLMCDKFVTTLDCIPFFEREIDRIDEMIIKEPLNHEKEFLNNKKRLNVAYLTKLYELEEKKNENDIK